MTKVVSKAPRRMVTDDELQRENPINLSTFFGLISLTFTVMTLVHLPSAQKDIWGLLGSGSVGLLLISAVASAILATVIALGQRRLYSAWFGVVATIAAFRLPTAFNGGYPMYGWTYKHLGVIDYIQTHHALASGTIDIYFAWPAMFAAVAWFSSVTGISAVMLANWFIVAIHVAQAGAIYFLARSLHKPRIAAVGAAFIAEILNWTGQDYFSPQAVAFVLAILLIGLLLRSKDTPSLGWLTIPLFAMITVTHQLTPYWIIILTGLLGFFKFIRPRWLVFLYAFIALGWLALNLDSIHRYGLFSGFNPLANAVRPSLGTFVEARHTTELMMKGAAVATWLGAGLVLAYRFFAYKAERRNNVLLPLILAFSSFVLLGGQNYGGEAIFRVLLYSLPVASVIIASAVVPGLRFFKKRAIRSSGVILVYVLIIFGVAGFSLQSTYATYFANRVTEADYKTSAEIAATMPSDTLSIALAPVGAGRATGDYVRFAKKNLAFDFTLPQMGDKYLNIDFKDGSVENDLTNELLNRGDPVVVMWTPQMIAYADYYGLYPKGALNRLVTQLEKDSRWKTVTDKNDVKLFTLKGTDQ